jgi:hypothetical protein
MMKASGRFPARIPPALVASLGVTISVSIAIVAIPRAAYSESTLRLDTGIGVGTYDPPTVESSLQRVEFERVTSTSLDLGLTSRPHDRINVGIELGYGYSWNGQETQTRPGGIGAEDLVCETELDGRNYLRMNGIATWDITSGETRPFLAAGGGLWIFLEKEAEFDTRCSDGTVASGTVRTLSSDEEPVLIVGGGVRFRDGHRLAYRLDYRANIIFEDRDESLVSQIRAGMLFRLGS